MNRSSVPANVFPRTFRRGTHRGEKPVPFTAFVRVVLPLTFLVIASGCKPKPPTVAVSSPSPASSPTPKPTPALQAEADGVASTIFDATGKKVFEWSGSSAGLDPTGGNPKAKIAGVRLALYQNGEKRAELRADSAHADAKSRTVSARGNVVVTSQVEGSVTKARADNVSWEYDTDTLRGSGNVLITYGPDWGFPAQSFHGNTRLENIEFITADRPGWGRL